MATPRMPDTTIILLEEIRQYLSREGCKDPKEAALHVVRLVIDDLLLNLQDRVEFYRKEAPNALP